MKELADWADFNVAVLGVAGGLAGLLIVALSVNIRTITRVGSFSSAQPPASPHWC